jgi:hypothetical protein
MRSLRTNGRSPAHRTATKPAPPPAAQREQGSDARELRQHECPRRLPSEAEHDREASISWMFPALISDATGSVKRTKIVNGPEGRRMPKDRPPDRRTSNGSRRPQPTTNSKPASSNSRRSPAGVGGGGSGRPPSTRASTGSPPVCVSTAVDDRGDAPMRISVTADPPGHAAFAAPRQTRPGSGDGAGRRARIGATRQITNRPGRPRPARSRGPVARVSGSRAAHHWPRSSSSATGSNSRTA